MIAKSLLALAGLSLAAPADPEAYVITLIPQVKFVQCLEGTGSAVRIEGNRFVSVDHVTRLTGCSIDGVPIAVTHASRAQDFSVLDAPDRMTGGLKVNCEGFKEGEQYWAIGHAEGLPWQRVLAVRSLGQKVVLREGSEPISVMIGQRFIGGMSGGVVANARWEIVGTVNALSTVFTNISFSRELKDTALCR